MSHTAPRTLERNPAHPRTNLSARSPGLGPWFHNLHLPEGVQTAPNHPLGDFPRFKWQRMVPSPAEKSPPAAPCSGHRVQRRVLQLRAGPTRRPSHGHRHRRAVPASGFVGGGPHRTRRPDSLRADGRVRPGVTGADLRSGAVSGCLLPSALSSARPRYRDVHLPQEALLPDADPAATRADESPANITLNETTPAGSAWPKMAFVEDSLEGDSDQLVGAQPAAVEAHAALLRLAVDPGDRGGNLPLHRSIRGDMPLGVRTGSPGRSPA